MLIIITTSVLIVFLDQYNFRKSTKYLQAIQRLVYIYILFLPSVYTRNHGVRNVGATIANEVALVRDITNLPWKRGKQHG